MAIIKSLIIAFSTYSKIPKPNLQWEEKNMKYAVCFFPLIGAVIGILWLGWFYIAGRSGFGNLLTAAVAALIPIIISGGIHLDGFCDITDAFSSWQPREKKLEILKDPHVGAFAVIGCGCYLLAYLGIMGEISFGRQAAVIACGFVLSRALSALALVNFKSARPHGMLDTFAAAAHKKIVTAVSLLYIIVCVAVMALIQLAACVAAVLAAALAFVLYRHLAYKKLGGTTGDMAGWFLQVCELAIPYFVVIIGGLL